VFAGFLLFLLVSALWIFGEVRRIKRIKFTGKIPVSAAPSKTGDVAINPATASIADTSWMKDMVWIPAGLFWMGSENGNPDEHPLHQIALGGFWMDKTEVTNEQFDKFVRATGYVTIAERKPDVVLLDWMLPLVSGIEVCRQIRRAPASRTLPIIMLTARGEEGDRVRGLDAGADDYVAKPFSPTELVARIRAVLRRIRPALADEALSYADIVMDLVAHRVTRAAKPVHLGPTEFRLLRHFMEHPGRVFSREQLLDAVWGKDVYVEARTVDVHIRRLRIALNGDQHTDLIRTVRAAGYALDATPG